MTPPPEKFKPDANPNRIKVRQQIIRRGHVSHPRNNLVIICLPSSHLPHTEEGAACSLLTQISIQDVQNENNNCDKKNKGMIVA